MVTDALEVEEEAVGEGAAESGEENVAAADVWESEESGLFCSSCIELSGWKAKISSVDSAVSDSSEEESEEGVEVSEGAAVSAEAVSEDALLLEASGSVFGPPQAVKSRAMAVTVQSKKIFFIKIRFLSGGEYQDVRLVENSDFGWSAPYDKAACADDGKCF